MEEFSGSLKENSAIVDLVAELASPASSLVSSITATPLPVPGRTDDDDASDFTSGVEDAGNRTESSHQQTDKPKVSPAGFWLSLRKYFFEEEKLDQDQAGLDSFWVQTFRFMEQENLNNRLEEICFNTDETHADEHSHGDDCTPSSGRDYLIEVQNPTIQTSLQALFRNTLHLILHDPNETKKALESYDKEFHETIRRSKMNYPSTSKRSESVTAESPFEMAKHGRFIDCLEPLERLVELNSKDTEAWALLAFSSYMCQNDPACISACLRWLSVAHEKDSARGLILPLLATCFVNESDVGACHAVLWQWISELTDMPETLPSLNLPQSERPSTVLLKVIGSALVRDPDDGPLNWAAAILKFSENKPADAGRHFETVLRRNPRSPCVLNQIAACLHNIDNFDAAINLQEEALKICPQFPRAKYMKAMTLCSLKRIAESLSVIVDAVGELDAKAPGHSDEFWYLAARIAPRLSQSSAEQRSLRVKIMSSVLSRNLTDLKNLISKLSSS